MNISWDKIVGHKKVVSSLKQLVTENKLPHALLFTGNEGIGKAVTAEALAAALLCNDSENGVPCGHCASCMGLLNGTHPDFYRIVPMTKNEYEGKAEKSVAAKRIIRMEQMRDMQEKASRVPVLSERNVIMLEAVDTMRQEAANAILKTIEEPEGPVVFIMLTSHPSALLDTIRSRCMTVEFGILSDEDVRGYLQAQGIPEFKAKMLASLADGSIGRAMALQDEHLQEIHSKANQLIKNIDTMTLEQIWQMGEQLDKWSRDDLREWLNFLAMLLRDMLVLHSGSAAGLYNQKEAQELGSMLGRFSNRKVDNMLNLVLACQYRMRQNVNIRLTMEAFLIRLKDICAN